MTLIDETSTIPAGGPTLEQVRRVVTELPGPRSAAILARKADAVASGWATPVNRPLTPSARSSGARPSNISRQAPTSVATAGMPMALASSRT